MDADRSESLVFPVPEMLRKRVTRLPTGLYVIPQEGTEGLLVAETGNGYVGIPTRCPHDFRKFQQTGTVDAAARTITCSAHCIVYSLDTGKAILNDEVPNDDPGELKIYHVERTRDEFIIDSFD